MSGDIDRSVLAGLRAKLDGSVVDRLVTLFGESVAERLTALADAIRAGDGRAAAVAVHSIKGSAQLVGARRLEEVSARWEAAAGAGAEIPERALEELRGAFEGARRSLAE